MLYVQLDANWPDNPKIIDAGVEGAGAHAIILCLAKRLETDGWVSRKVLRRYNVHDDLIDTLVELRLIGTGERGVIPWDWHDRNPSQDAIDAIRASKAEGGKRGNHKKWKHLGTFEACPKCNPPKPQVVAGSDRTQVAGDNSCDRIPTKSESTSEVPTAIRLATSEGLTAPMPAEGREVGLAALRSMKNHAANGAGSMSDGGAA